MLKPKLFENFNTMYHSLLRIVWQTPDNIEKYTNIKESINRQTYKESYNICAGFNVECDIKNMYNKVQVFECVSIERAKKMQEYLDNERKMFDMMDIFNHHKISNFWSHIKNPDGTSNANYGYMTFGIKDARAEWEKSSKHISQFEYCFEILKNRLNSKQGIIHFHRPKDQWFGNKDVPCNLALHFYITTNESNINKLCLSAYLRSNDLIYGTPYNIFYFLHIYEQMYRKLLKIYPNLKYGIYYHHVSSMRIYVHHQNILNSIIRI